MKYRGAVIIVFVLLWGCRFSPDSSVELDSYPPIYPDYSDIVIPENIAPLNFLLREEIESVFVEVKGDDTEIRVRGKNKIQFPDQKWRSLLENEDSVRVSVSVRQEGVWKEYASFQWEIMQDSIDPFLSYRLIEPGYEVWNNLQLVERNVENFDQRVLADNDLTDGSCMNCHITSKYEADKSMFHLRGKNGGTILNSKGELRKLNIKSDEMISPAVYGGFHPSGRFGVFSTNIIIPEFHSQAPRKLEVYDTKSNVVVVDFQENQILSTPLLSNSGSLNTFPEFSADGQSIFYCSAPSKPLPDSIRKLRYNLCELDFDPETREFGKSPRVLVNARANDQSVCHLKVSPNGKFLIYTVADYGTFPIWHAETDLNMIYLETGRVDSLKQVNARYSDSYHSWSSNSRWIVFASKRDNGLYGKPYFCHVDEAGRFSKPFVLPQKDPAFYDYNLKSFNIPELSPGSVSFDAFDVESVYEEKDIEPFTGIIQKQPLSPTAGKSQ